MRPISRIWILIVVYGTLLLATAAATASVLPTHAHVEAITQYGGIETGPGTGMFLPGEHVIHEADSPPLDTGLLSWNGTQGPYGLDSSARGVVRVDPNHLLGVSASGSGSVPGMFADGGNAMAVAAFRDVAFTNAANPPSSIRLSFGVEGLMSVPFIPDTFENMNVQSLVAVGIRTSTDAVGFFENPYLASRPSSFFPGARVMLEGRFGVTAEGWDTITVDDDGHFAGTVHLDVPFDVNLNGYGFGIALSTDVYTRLAWANSNALNSLSLTGATLLDGTPLSVTFDSGLQIVPEPSGALLFGIGFVALTGLVLRKRRK